MVLLTFHVGVRSLPQASSREDMTDLLKVVLHICDAMILGLCNRERLDGELERLGHTGGNLELRVGMQIKK